jgi:hypothetical protein
MEADKKRSRRKSKVLNHEPQLYQEQIKNEKLTAALSGTRTIERGT